MKSGLTVCWPYEKSAFLEKSKIEITRKGSQVALWLSKALGDGLRCGEHEVFLLLAELDIRRHLCAAVYFLPAD